MSLWADEPLPYSFHTAAGSLLCRATRPDMLRALRGLAILYRKYRDEDAPHLLRTIDWAEWVQKVEAEISRLEANT